MENVGGILKFSAEPDGGNAFTLIHSFDSGFFKPEAEGLAIYYGPHGTGYLLISSQGDSTFAVFRREGNNEYLGSFVVGDVLDIDQANETDGLDVINVPLGDRFPFGLLVVQDGFNDPQFAAQDDEELENWSTNFKFVSWADVAARLGLIVDTGSFNPRSSFSSQRR
jgi:myo-inositol-hexaphosphate 3-phosphohydrolase